MRLSGLTWTPKESGSNWWNDRTRRQAAAQSWSSAVVSSTTNDDLSIERESSWWGGVHTCNRLIGRNGKRRESVNAENLERLCLWLREMILVVEHEIEDERTATAIFSFCGLSSLLLTPIFFIYDSYCFILGPLRAGLLWPICISDAQWPSWIQKLDRKPQLCRIVVITSFKLFRTILVNKDEKINMPVQVLIKYIPRKDNTSQYLKKWEKKLIYLLFFLFLFFGWQITVIYVAHGTKRIKPKEAETMSLKFTVNRKKDAQTTQQ